MAAGGTIPGKLRILKQNQAGDKEVLMSGIDTTLADEDGTGILFFNLPPDRLKTMGASEQNRRAPFVFMENEKIIIEHKSASLEEAIDYDLAASIGIGIMKVDLNTKKRWQETLVVGDTELTANPTASKSAWVEIFRDAVPTRQSMILFDKFHCIAGEVS